MVILYSESYITLNRKDQLEKDKKTIFAKDIVIKNRIFIQQHIVLYADNHTHRADLKDIISTAKSVGMDIKYRIIYDPLCDVVQ
jgi:hypothetical protein